MTSHRIAFYMPSLSGGGVEKSIVLLTNELVGRNIPCMVIVNDSSGPNRELLHSDVEVVVLKRVVPIVSRVLRLRKVLLRWRATAIFAQNGFSPLFAVAAHPTGRKWKTVLSMHNPMVNASQFEEITGLKRIITRLLRHMPIFELLFTARKIWFLMPVLGRLAHHTFGVSHDIERQLLERGVPAKKCSTINNPVDLRWIEKVNAEDGSSSHQHPEIPTDRPYILSVGRLVPQKAYPNLIKAFALIADKIDANLVILGEGPQEELLRERVRRSGLTGRVYFLGYLKNPFPLYEKARMFALSSHYEGFGLVLTEALAFGLPIVANNGPGGPKEVLDHGKYGRLISDGDIHAFAEAMLETFSEKQTDEEKASLIARAKEFSVERIADQYLALLE